MEISAFAWQIFGLLGMPRATVFSREMSQVGSILHPVLLQWLVEQLQIGSNIPRFGHSTCTLLMPRIYDAAVDGLSDSQTHSGGIATPALCHRVGAEAL